MGNAQVSDLLLAFADALEGAADGELKAVEVESLVALVDEILNSNYDSPEEQERLVKLAQTLRMVATLLEMF